MSARALAVVALVVLAGCTAATPDSLVTGGESAADSTATVDSDNPWRERTLTVGLETPDGGDRDYRPLVRSALDYWETNAEQYAGYPISFRIDDDDPDVVVRFVAEVTGCEDVQEAAGCAPYVTNPAGIQRPEHVEVLSGLTNESTVLVLKHEFGHVLGLNHDDRPTGIMSASEELSTLPQPNASDRVYPWTSSTLSVYVDLSGVPEADREAVREQVRHAMTYYDRGAGGRVPSNVSLAFTDSRSDADVVVRFPEEAPCAEGDGSCGYRYGADPDRDGAPEWYTKVEIAVAGIDTSAIGWHIGYWLGYGFGFSEPSDWPEVFRQASASDRRSDWWVNVSSPWPEPDPALAA